MRWSRGPFASSSIGALLLAVTAVCAVFAWRFLQWAIVDAHWQGASSEACTNGSGACWAFIAARWKPWLVGDYPTSELWRVWLSFAAFGLFALWVIRRSRVEPLGRVLAGFVVLPVALALLLLGGGPLSVVPPTRLGGLLLTMVVALLTFASALPAGLCLALGRRSRMPVVRFVCASFVEGMRSVPLLAVLFIAVTLLPMFLPRGAGIDLFFRAVIAFALFNAAMAAEVFRGGLQSVGRGQIEAATTVGLSDFATLRLVVLPQAVTAVVPALVNVMISIIKETTLLSVIGIDDLLAAVENGAKSPDWMGDSNILTSGYVFLALVYLFVCYALSRYSRRLETQR
ncbi:MAG TPA: amino acid ABC transporter permease [Casimicrobiaceae bacterium]|nr:amino acid ABC transporter permease [Casimicrobiaceae bacterium]